MWSVLRNWEMGGGHSILNVGVDVLSALNPMFIVARTRTIINE